MDFLLKQRLVGAVVLVALGVIFIPMLLEGPDRNLVPEMEPLPEPQEQDFGQPLEPFVAEGETSPQPERAVVQADAPEQGDEEPSGEGTADDQAGAQPLPLPEPEPQETPGGEPVEQAVQKPAAAPEAPAAAPAQAKAGEAGRLGDWVVQMGSFSSEQNALRLRERLRKAGFVTQVEKVVVGGKTLFRVRVGPYLERSEADRDKQKISETLKLEGRVLSYP